MQTLLTSSLDAILLRCLAMCLKVSKWCLGSRFKTSDRQTILSSSVGFLIASIVGRYNSIGGERKLISIIYSSKFSICRITYVITMMTNDDHN